MSVQEIKFKEGWRYNDVIVTMFKNQKTYVLRNSGAIFPGDFNETTRLVFYDGNYAVAQPQCTQDHAACKILFTVYKQGQFETEERQVENARQNGLDCVLALERFEQLEQPHNMIHNEHSRDMTSLNANATVNVKYKPFVNYSILTIQQKNQNKQVSK